MAGLQAKAGRSEDIDALGRSEHPNVDEYKSGGIGHRTGDESRSVVGFLPTALVRSYREHGGDWYGASSRAKVDAIKADLEAGKGLTNPVEMDYDHQRGWGYLGEGNHRVQAAHEAGIKTVPVRVYGRARLEGKQQQGIGGPMHLNTDFTEQGAGNKDYMPPAVHPHHFTYPGGLTHSYDYSEPQWQGIHGKQAAVLDEWAPTERLFAPTKGGVDPRLFRPDRTMRPRVRLAILTHLSDFWHQHGYDTAPSCVRVYLAGSQASEWYGNNDFDILVGINFPEFVKRNPVFEGMSPVEVGTVINGEFRDDFNDEHWHPPFDRTHEWHLTGYVNQNSWDIREIKPYAAYNVTDDVWAVDPIDEPTGHHFDTSAMYYFEGIAAQVRGAMKMPEPHRTEQLALLWTFVHTDRSRAFGPHGTGLFDRGNALEKYLDQAPSGIEGKSLMAVLAEARYGKTASASSLEYRHTQEPGSSAHRISAHDGDQEVGHLSWQDGFGDRVGTVAVDEGYRRRGIASEMLRRAREVNPRLRHSQWQSEDGKAWSEKTAASAASHKNFYLPEGGGKYHRANPITGQALCRGSLLLDTTMMPFTVADDAERVHPMVCRKCLGADHPANRKQALRDQSLVGSHDIDRLFPEGRSKSPTPWSMIGRTKSNPIPYRKDLLGKALADPGKYLADVDVSHPSVHSYQPDVTRAGVQYYLGDTYRQTGQTYADEHHVGNQFPVVYTRSDGKSIILSGHHRAAAALLKGEPLTAIHIREDDHDAANAVHHAVAVPGRGAEHPPHVEGGDGGAGAGRDPRGWGRRVAAWLGVGGHGGADVPGDVASPDRDAAALRSDGLAPVVAWYASSVPEDLRDDSHEEFGPDTEGVKAELTRLRGGPRIKSSEVDHHWDNGTVPKHLYRAISETDFQRAKAQGYLDTHGEKNWMRPDKGEHAEGMVTATDPHEVARTYIPDEGGRVVKIETHPEHGWRPHGHDYVRRWQTKTHDTPVPWEHIVDHSAPIKRIVNPETWSTDAVRLESEHDAQPPLHHLDDLPTSRDYFKRLMHPSFHYLADQGKTAARIRYWQPEPAPEGQHAYYRGLYLGGLTNSTFHPPVDGKGIGHHTHEHLDPDNDEHVLSKIRTRTPEDLANPHSEKWAMYGSHWTTDHYTAKKFALDAQHGQYRHPRPPSRPTWGVVLEAHTPNAPSEQAFHNYEPEVLHGPTRSEATKVVAHLHHYDPEHPDGLRQETYQRTIEVPESHWKKAIRTTAGIFGPEWYESAHDDEIDSHPAADSLRSYMTEHTSPQGHVYRLTHDSSKYVSAAYLGKGENRIKKPQMVGRLSYFGGKVTPGNNIDGRIYKVFVKPAHRRRGLASAMLDHARNMAAPGDEIQHSDALSEDGAAWAEKKASKAAASYYHVAPRSARESITEHGLDHTKGASPWANYGPEFRNFPRGNYLFTDRGDAAAYKHPGDQDLWEVDAEGLAAQPDPLMESHKPGSAVLATEPIPAHRLRLAKKANSIEVAGVCVKAADTGRVLMLQRSFEDESDPARGTWEFPGGHIDDGENPFEAARREWCEETGGTFPDDAPVVGNWISGGMYQGFVVLIEAEADLDINLDHEDRQVLNPDDPDGDGIEVVAWWEIKHLAENPAVRKEVRKGTDWDLLKKAKASTKKAASVDEPYLHASNVLFEPGHRVLPANQVDGIKSPYAGGHNEHYSGDHVYLYKASEVPKDFRLQGGAVYEVHPHGEVEPDPEPWRGQKGAPGSYRTKGPVTVTRLVENNWRDPKARIPAGMRGPDWTPSEQPRAKHQAKKAASAAGLPQHWQDHIDSFRAAHDAHAAQGAEDWRNPQDATGACLDAAGEFARHVRERSGGQHEAREEFFEHLKDVPPRRPNVPDGKTVEHLVNVTQDSGHVIDWTARQFHPGADFPHVEPVESYRAKWHHTDVNPQRCAGCKEVFGDGDADEQDLGRHPKWAGRESKTATRGLGWHHIKMNQGSNMYPHHAEIEAYIKQRTGVHPDDLVWSKEPYSVSDAFPDPHGFRSRQRLQSAEDGYRQHPAQMPPIIALDLDGQREHVDGWHRLGGAERAGLTQVPAYVGRLR